MATNVSIDSEGRVTKRIILSIVSKIFDPIGFTCPALIIPKLLVQQSWKEQIGWDSPVSDETRKQFLKWLKDMPYIFSIEIPRWITFENGGEVSIHTFCDASMIAYATAIFIRIKKGSDVSVNLIAARSRLSPLKALSIPRLELMAATIGARLYNNLVECFPAAFTSYFWSDSSTVISWIKRRDEWSTFVWNRVQEINKLSSPDSWRHVPGHENPADLPSRGCLPRSLCLSRWWEGPKWLYLDQSQWPSENITINEEEVNQERKKKILTMVNKDTVDWHLWYFSNHLKTVRMIAWIHRYVKNLKVKVALKKLDMVREPRVGPLSVTELAKAETFILKIVQSTAFSDNYSHLKNLQPFVDEEGHLRIKTRISLRNDVQDFVNPILLPSKNKLVESLISYYHVKNCHVGTQVLLSLLRERFWIIGGRRTIRSIVNRCVICRRQTSHPCRAPQAPLPVDRVRDAKVFEVTGVDFAGPLFIKPKGKAWICLFTCAVYRAIHLELTTSLSTEGFLQVLRRFIARRGRPSTIFSDNGTNFVGANNAFGELNWDAIEEYSAARRIQWRFNPPSAPWWGGFWERLIGLCKQILRKVLGRTSLSYEELFTVICDCEALINSRPITYLSEDMKDLAPLTPAKFLQDLEVTGVPDCDEIDSSTLERRIAYRKSVRDALRLRFRNEYLGALHSSKPSKPISIGDIVLVGSDNTKRMDWPLGRVVEVLPGKDGVVRLVRVETARGQLMRPIQRLYPLEVIHRPEALSDSSPDPSGASKPSDLSSNSDLLEKTAESDSECCAGVLKGNFPKISKCGRVIKKPKRLLE